MNHESALALISELYATVGGLRTLNLAQEAEIAELKERLAERGA